jgi:hypothetical protein
MPGRRHSWFGFSEKRKQPIEPRTFHPAVRNLDSLSPLLGLLNDIAEMWKGAGVTSLRNDPSIYRERRKKRERTREGQTKIST